jgi:outer membrane protein OmpA-like peptidoglycan-associated protein
VYSVHCRSIIIAAAMFMAAAMMLHAQHIPGEYSIGIDLGLGIPGDDFTGDQTGYPVSPFGGASLEYVVYEGFSAHASLVGGYLKNTADDLILRKYYKLKFNAVDYITTYYGGLLGVSYTFPPLYGIRPMAMLRAGMSRLTAETHFDALKKVEYKNALLYGPEVALELPIAYSVALRVGFSAIYTNSDYFDGVSFPDSKNDGLSHLGLSVVWTLNPATPEAAPKEVPAVRPIPKGTRPGGAIAKRTPSGTESRTGTNRTAPTQPRGETRTDIARREAETEQPRGDARTEAPRADAETEEPLGASDSSPRTDTRADGGQGEGERAIDSLGVDSPLPSDTSDLPPTDDLPVVADGAVAPATPPKQQPAESISSTLDVRDFHSIADLQAEPRSMQLTVKQQENHETPVRVLFEMTRGSEMVVSGSKEMTLRKDEQVFQPMQFLDLAGLSIAEKYRDGLPTDEYDIITSIRPQNGTESSVASRRIVFINYESLFASDAEKVRNMVRSRKVGVGLLGPDDVMFNTFGQDFPADAQYALPKARGQATPIPASEVIREAASVIPPDISGTERQSYLANTVRESFGKSMAILNSGQKAPDSPERLSSIVAEVYFPFDAAQLTDESKTVLDQLAQLLAQHPEVNAEIRGFADEVGDDAYNVLLSQRRADRVYEYLNRRQIPDTRIHSHGMGKARFNLSRTPTEEQRNRKVQIVIGDGMP